MIEWLKKKLPQTLLIIVLGVVTLWGWLSKALDFVGVGHAIIEFLKANFWLVASLVAAIPCAGIVLLGDWMFHKLLFRKERKEFEQKLKLFEDTQKQNLLTTNDAATQYAKALTEERNKHAHEVTQLKNQNGQTLNDFNRANAANTSARKTIETMEQNFILPNCLSAGITQGKKGNETHVFIRAAFNIPERAFTVIKYLRCRSRIHYWVDPISEALTPAEMVLDDVELHNEKIKGQIVVEFFLKPNQVQIVMSNAVRFPYLFVDEILIQDQEGKNYERVKKRINISPCVITNDEW